MSNNGKRARRRPHNPESGFALPSVLMLVVILSLVAFSILLLQYLRKESALRDVAVMKAEYAAQSGVARVLADNPERVRDTSYIFGDESRAAVTTTTWGSYILVISEGSFRKTKTIRVALAAARMPALYSAGLIFTNDNHQLVFTGTASVDGDVVLGKAGATVGTLSDFPTPRSMPVHGKIKTLQSLPPVNNNPQFIEHAIHIYDDFLQSSSSFGRNQFRSISITVNDSGAVNLSSIPDTIDILYTRGNVVLLGEVKRRIQPLKIFIDGNAVISSSARMYGLVAILASGSVKVMPGADLRQTILTSKNGIQIEKHSAISAQLFAPIITIDTGAVMSFPSLAFTGVEKNIPSVSRSIVLRQNARFEGTMFFYMPPAASQSDENIVIEPTAHLKGFLRCDNQLTLDGIVDGVVLTRDFYFYHS